jgi:hypothetical protein
MYKLKEERKGITCEGMKGKGFVWMQTTWYLCVCSCAHSFKEGSEDTGSLEVQAGQGRTSILAIFRLCPRAEHSKGALEMERPPQAHPAASSVALLWSPGSPTAPQSHLNAKGKVSSPAYGY